MPVLGSGVAVVARESGVRGVAVTGGALRTPMQSAGTCVERWLVLALVAVDDASGVAVVAPDSGVRGVAVAGGTLSTANGRAGIPPPRGTRLWPPIIRFQKPCACPRSGTASEVEWSDNNVSPGVPLLLERGSGRAR